MLVPSSRSLVAAALAVLTLAFAGAPEALAKKAVVGPVSLDVPDDFQNVAANVPKIHQQSSGVTVEVSELPPQALHEFVGTAFLDYLQSLGFTNPSYTSGLKRTDPHTYILADAKGAEGPEKRFLLVIGGQGRAAIVSAYAPNSELANGHASRGGIEAILDSAAVLPASAATAPAAIP